MHDLKQFNFMEVAASKQKCSMSKTSERKIEGTLNNLAEASSFKLGVEELKSSVGKKQRQSPKMEVQDSLMQEILQLQKGLRGQFAARLALERALGHMSFPFDTTSQDLMLKHAEDLIKEVAILELEVVYLEKYLLSLYRKQFNKEAPTSSSIDGNLNSITHRTLSEDSGLDTAGKEHSVSRSAVPPSSITKPVEEHNEIWGAQKLLDSGIHRSHSSISHHSICSLRASPPREALAEAVQCYYSLPLSMLERVENSTSGGISLAEHLGEHVSNYVPDTPNWLSEEIIKCISSIYCKLAEPPLFCHDISSSPVSLSSSADEFSPSGQCNAWSPSFREHKLQIVDPFSIEGSQEHSAPCGTMVEVQWIRRDSKSLRDVEQMLRKFTLLISQLNAVDPRKMKHEEKLAFWINIHNALAMHAFLVYGIPKNNSKRYSLLLKAAYNIGGQTTSIDMIQNSILGCRLPHPGQWYRFLFYTKMKFRAKHERKLYAIEHPDPRLHFALCSGSHSDPPVRIFTPKRVFQDLEVAKEEYIQTTGSLRKDQKLLLPKLVEQFAKDLNLSPVGLLETIEPFLPDSLRKSLKQTWRGKLFKSIEWKPHNFNFRYLLSKELAESFL